MKKNFLVLVVLVFCTFVFVGCGAKNILPDNSYTYSRTFSTDEELEFFNIDGYCTSLTGTYTLAFTKDGGTINLETTVVFEEGAAEQAKEVINGNCAAYEEALSKSFAWSSNGNDVDIVISDIPVFTATPTMYANNKDYQAVQLAATIGCNN